MQQFVIVGSSPIYTQVSTTLDGISSIKAFNLQDQFTKTFEDILNRQASAWFVYISGTFWFRMQMDILMAITVIAILLVSLCTKGENHSSEHICLSIFVFILL